MTRSAKLLLAVLTLHAASPVSAGPDVTAPSPQMSVAAFLGRVGELAKTGPEWTLGPEAGKLFGVISEVGKSYRQNLAERRAANQPVEACLPETAEIDSDVLFAHLAGYSAEAAGRTSIAEAFAELVRKRFACP